MTPLVATLLPFVQEAGNYWGCDQRPGTPCIPCVENGGASCTCLDIAERAAEAVRVHLGPPAP